MFKSAPKQNDADGGGNEDASDGAHDVTERKRAGALRYAGEQLRDKRQCPKRCENGEDDLNSFHVVYGADA